MIFHVINLFANKTSTQNIYDHHQQYNSSKIAGWYRIQWQLSLQDAAQAVKGGGIMKNEIDIRYFVKILLVVLFVEIIATGIAAADTGKQYTSSVQCKGCHEQIYNEWSTSMHSQALSDPIFQGALSQQKDKTICISCHAPITRLNGDFNMTEDITKEAISCDFCHTISGLNESNHMQPFILDPGETKYGQYADSASVTHKSKDLDLLGKSEFCQACHDLAFPNGLVVLSTYAEWKDSDYAKDGIVCQDCHMKTTKRSIASGAGERSDSRRHDWKGGHFIEMLQTAGKLEVTTKTEGKKVFVTAVISNDGAGHKFPTGADTKLILEIAATDKNGNRIFENKTQFSKVFGDANGNAVPVPDLATQILSDNRIQPKGRSTNEFSFDASGYDGDIKITGALLYRLTPEEVIPPVKIFEENKTVRLTEGKTGAKSIPGFMVAAAVAGMIAAYLSRWRKK